MSWPAKLANSHIYISAVIFLGLAVFGLYEASRHHYLLFHSIVEIASIVVAFGIFLIAWNTRRSLDNNYVLFIGIAYLFIAVIDLVHTLAYRGMGVLQGYTSNLPHSSGLLPGICKASLFSSPLCSLVENSEPHLC